MTSLVAIYVSYVRFFPHRSGHNCVRVRVVITGKELRKFLKASRVFQSHACIHPKKTELTLGNYMTTLEQTLKIICVTLRAWCVS